jgi:rhodanese-related sulfurtransferase
MSPAFDPALHPHRRYNPLTDRWVLVYCRSGARATKAEAVLNNAGIEVRQRNGEAFPWMWRVGAKICLAARRQGILTRPVLDTIVFMPPLCVTAEEMEAGLQAIRAATQEVLLKIEA